MHSFVSVKTPGIIGKFKKFPDFSDSVYNYSNILKSIKPDA